MDNPRKGLKRIGQRAYEIRGPRGIWRIERDKPNVFFVSKEPVLRPAGLFAQRFTRLGQARLYAEDWAGIERQGESEAPRPWCPVRDLPPFLRRVPLYV